MGKNFEPVFMLRRFESLNVPEYSWLTQIVGVEDWGHLPTLTANVLNQLGLNGKRIGVEKQGWFYTVEEHETLTSALPGAEFDDAISILWGARMIKSEEEIKMMGRSADIVDKAMLAGWEASAPGVSDDVINAEVNRVIFENGGEYMGLPPFVLSGERTCLWRVPFRIIPRTQGGAGPVHRLAICLPNSKIFSMIHRTRRCPWSGLLMAIEICNKVSKQQWPDDFQTTERLRRIGLTNGLILYARRNNFGKFGDWVMTTPPLTITETECDDYIQLGPASFLWHLQARHLLLVSNDATLVRHAPILV